MLRCQHLIWVVLFHSSISAIELKNYTLYQHLSPTNNVSALKPSMKNEDLNITEIRLEMLNDLKQIVHFVDGVLQEKKWTVICNETNSYRKPKYFNDKTKHRKARKMFGIDLVKKRNSTRRIFDCHSISEVQNLTRKLLINEDQMEHYLDWLLKYKGSSWATISCVDNFHLYFNSTLDILDQLQEIQIYPTINASMKNETHHVDLEKIVVDTLAPNETLVSGDDLTNFNRELDSRMSLIEQSFMVTFKPSNLSKPKLNLENDDLNSNDNGVTIPLTLSFIGLICLTIVGLAIHIKKNRRTQKFQRLEDTELPSWTEREITP